MQYRKMKDGTEVSILGYGCMRFPRSLGQIDRAETEKQLLYAFEQGVNYFDTAYMYTGSEDTLGAILEKNRLREKVNIAAKIPQYLVKKPEEFDRYFDTECRRLKTDYIDFYLLHMLADKGRFEKLKEMGIEEWIRGKKESGAIRNIGFSFHGDTDTFCSLIDAFDWDFCQIQYNYLDEHTQAGRRGLQYAAARGIPVVIMEPLRGGRLVQYMPASARKEIGEYRIKRSPAEWAFRWLWDQPEVTCVLSGMNSIPMIEENCRVASEVQTGEFTPEDHELIARIREEINRNYKIGCTGCGYCMPCPQGVDIPSTFACYNSMYAENRFMSRTNYLMNTAFRKSSADYTKCVGCGKCAQHCPQHLEIPQLLKEAGSGLSPWYFRAAKAVMRKFTV